MQVFCEGGSAHVNVPKVLKSKIWQEVVPKLQVVNGEPAHNSVPLRTSAGPCTVPGNVPDGAAIS